MKEAAAVSGAGVDGVMDGGYEEEGYAGYGEDMIDEPDVSQEDCWDVIRAFFAEKGLVRQQLDSFNEFVHNTMQELVDEVKSLTLEQSSQHTGREDDKAVSSSCRHEAPSMMVRSPRASALRALLSVDTRSNLVRSTSRDPT